ncbi:MAG: zinc-binding alcohol dehydrogenase family protein [Ignavibacteria bacterium]|nr:zinc-binding alcohol dehydrogenase family protein [Ignavibacteria bacterium]
MKAAVILKPGETPQCISFPEPVVKNDDELLMTVKAAAIKHFDKLNARGNHYYAGEKGQAAKVIGSDGVGILADGSRVYALGTSGMIAEKAAVMKSRLIKLPDEVDDVTAAALPNAVTGSAMAIRFRAAMLPGETVLINGATGFTGKLAVQIAKHYGAGKIIATGRNRQTLQSLIALGADETILIKEDDESFIADIKQQHANTPIDIIIDYLWGHTAELILASVKGNGSFTNRTRFVSVGAVTGSNIRLSSEILRSADLQLTGSGLGSWSKIETIKLFTEILPEMFQLAAGNKLKVDTEKVSLSDIGKAWSMEVQGGKRLVVTM